MTKPRMISNKEWSRYKSIINDFIDHTAGKQPFLWLRKINQMPLFGEDSNGYTVVRLEGLFQYNYIRTWPANRDSISGELEGENMVLYISLRLLRDNNYINSQGYPDINWSEDRFILNGKVYKPDGDTTVAQAGNESLLFFVILKREDPGESLKIKGTSISYAEVVTEKGKSLINYPHNTTIDREIPNIMGI